jgi:hypothetical protein
VDAAPDEKIAQLFHGAADARLGRVFADPHGGSDLFQILAFKETEDDGAVIFLSEARHGGVEQWSDVGPRRGFGLGLVQQGLHINLLFAALATALRSRGVGGGELGGAAKPSRENRFRAERWCLACQNDEGGLRDFFRQMGVTKLAQGNQINQIDMP